MPITANGTQLTAKASFNTGILDINGLDFPIATLSDITVEWAVSTKELRGLGSIKMATAPKRSTFKTDCKAKVKSLNKEIFGFFGGSSGPDSTGTAYGMVDGQNVLERVTVTCYIDDANTQAVQYQFTNAILAGNLSTALKSEDFGEVDIEIQAQDMKIVTNW
jgi:hypothetical protein